MPIKKNGQKSSKVIFEKVSGVHPLRYVGSNFWLIIAAICFFPIAGLLLLCNLRTVTLEDGNEVVTRYSYNGSMGWLIFCTICFFPIAVILFCVNGVTVYKSSSSAANN